MNANSIKSIILHTITTEKRNILLTTAIMAAIFLLFSTLFTGTWVDGSNTLRISYSGTTVMAKIAVFVCMIASASKMMAPLKNRRSSISYLMLPADNIDKFVSRWIIGVVGYTLMFLTALIAADAAQALYNIAFRYTTGSITMTFFDNVLTEGFMFFDENSPFLRGFFDGILGFLLVHALYTLGATFFRNNSFIKTTLLFIGIMILGSIIIASISIPLVYSDREYTVRFLVDPEIMANITFYAITIAATIGAYWWAYRRFCNKMIV